MEILCKKPIYYVSSDRDSTVLIGMDFRIEGNMIVWFDTVKERRMKFDNIVENTENKFAFNRADGSGGVYEFLPMTLEIYSSKVKSKLIAGKEFTDEAEMQKAFINTKKEVW